jgi:hypothetical protein
MTVSPPAFLKKRKRRLLDRGRAKPKTEMLDVLGVVAAVDPGSTHTTVAPAPLSHTLTRASQAA